MSRLMKTTASARFVKILKKCLSKRNFVLDATKAATVQQAEPKTQTHFASGIVTSPLGPCKKIPNENLVEYVWKKSENWLDKPAAVSFGVSLLRIYLLLNYFKSRERYKQVMCSKKIFFIVRLLLVSK